jgi:hypothetical protein
MGGYNICLPSTTVVELRTRESRDCRKYAWSGQKPRKKKVNPGEKKAKEGHEFTS